jgi:NAD(P)H-hydrate epimerase
MRTGAGAVVLGVPESIYSILGRKVTEVMVTPLSETPEGTVALLSEEMILERAEWADVVVVGPGLSRSDETQRLILDILPRIRRPVVVDADGLASIGRHPAAVLRRREATVLTPHVGELSRMIGEKGAAIERERVEKARSAASIFRSTVLLKGAPTATGFADGRVFLNSSGNPGMATAGSGDVLTGVIAALIGQGLSPEMSAVAGAYLHGRAGDDAGRRLGMRSLLALDILDSIPAALKEIEV